MGFYESRETQYCRHEDIRPLLDSERNYHWCYDCGAVRSGENSGGIWLLPRSATRPPKDDALSPLTTRVEAIEQQLEKQEREKNALFVKVMRHIGELGKKVEMDWPK